jgi:hypothetical protein
MTERCMDRFALNWNKQSPKFKQTLQQKLISRGVEPTFKNCRAYWNGKIRPYKDTRTGQVRHLHIRDIIINKRRFKNGPSRPMANQNRRKKRRFNR